jgi:hypothetical protein
MRSDSGCARLALMLGVLLLPTLPARPAPVLIERVLADVDGLPVLLSDVRLVQHLRGLTFEPALAAVIDERLMFQEAARLTQSALSADEEAAAYRALAAQARAAGLPADALRRLARRQAVILKYVEFRFRPQVRVTDEQLREAYARAYPDPNAPTFEEVSAELREQALRRQLDEAIEAWVRDLRAAADVRPVSPAE